MAWRKWPEIRGYTDEQRVGWLVSVAARKAIDTFRRNETERTHAMAVYEHHRPAEHDVHSQSVTHVDGGCAVQQGYQRDAARA